MVVDRHGETALALVTPQNITTVRRGDLNGRPEIGSTNLERLLQDVIQSGRNIPILI